MTTSSVEPANTSSLAKSYDPQQVETRLYAEWEAQGLFAPPVTAQSEERPFSLVIPPPNVTGVLHMGHALDCTIQDILVRWHRMSGDATLWMPGMDHAGIATQNVVERHLREAKLPGREEMGREAFVAKVTEWSDARKNDIAAQFKKLGISPDWSRQRFTLDDGLSKAVRHAFVHLYNKSLIVRDTYIVNWCPRCVSAISDIETEYKDEDGSLWEIRYPVVPEEREGLTGPLEVIVVTTRPETLYGDVAVAVNPQDSRYAALIGKKVQLPLTERKIPVIADDYVDSSFGTGVLKITPAHDPNDYEIGKRHNLESIRVIDERGRIALEDFIPGEIRGLDRQAAKQRTEALLQESGYLVSKKDHAHRVGHCQRCQTVIEPLLSQQWFVKTKPLAERCLQSHAAGEIRFIPERWTKDYLRWLTDIQDWCISRQLWWGHRIPAWHCDACGKISVALEDPTVCQHCQSDEIQQDNDVLDTWFSSGLWPFSTMGWPDTEASDFKRFYPTNVLVTGFDIIFFWVARMTMLGLELTGQSPFETVYIHGLIRDEKGQKMSKSKGNTIDPVLMIDELGCDAFRFGLTSLITYGGQDIKLAKEKMEQGRLFANKLWNATRFVLMNICPEDGSPAVDTLSIDTMALTLMDRWILSRYHTAVQEANRLLGDYKFGELADTLYEFTWNGFCDWYVEAAKTQMRDEITRANTQRILFHVLDGILRLLHPIMPYVTEELSSKLPHRRTASIMIDTYPQAELSLIQPEVSLQIDHVLEVVRAIRNIRQQYAVPHPQAVPVRIVSPDAQERTALEAGRGILERFVTLASLTVSETLNVVETAQSAINVVGHSRIIVPLEGLIDIEQERSRLEKKTEVLLKEQKQLFGMLANLEFLERAPIAVVEKNKARLHELNQQLKTLEDQLAQLSG
jgi:valyl-tRNA synthetase